jgi:hypothetical protein
MLAIAMLALCSHALAAAGTTSHPASPQHTRVNSILQRHAQPARPAANNHAPGKPAAKRKSDQQLRAEVLAIERDGTGYISPARQRVLDQQAGKSGVASGH